MASRQRVISGVLFLGAIFSTPGFVFGQCLNLPDSVGTYEPVIQVKSNLVLVPVFVFTRYGLQRKPSPEERQCLASDRSAFSMLRSNQPYFPKECDPGEVRDLTLDDFRLFQDGKPQEIEAADKVVWPRSVRDNNGWHIETSYTPAGVWSSGELGELLVPGTRSFYLLRYVPTDSSNGCHRIQVKVDRPGARVFARDQFCTAQTPSDLLSGTKVGKKLERELSQGGHGKIPLSIQPGVFYGEGARAFVRVALEFPWNQLNHSWDVDDGTFKARIAVLGAVNAKDGCVTTQFSDLLWPSYWPTIVLGYDSYFRMLTAVRGGYTGPLIGEGLSLLSRQEPVLLPTRYQTQFNLDPGKYDLQVVISDGRKFGRAEAHLSVEKYDGTGLALSSIMLCKRYRDAHVAAAERAAANFAPQYVPMVSKGMEVTPAGDLRFKQDEPLIPYFEIYAPLLAGGEGTAPQMDSRLRGNDVQEGAGTPASAGMTTAEGKGGSPQSPPNHGNPPVTVQAKIRILDAKTGEVVKDFPPVDAAPYMNPGSTTIPVAREVLYKQLPKGAYRLEVQASDSAGLSTDVRTADFAIE